MPSQHTHRKELEEMGSPLANMPVEMPFRTPPDYFRQTLKQVMARIHEDSEKAYDSPEAELQSLSPRLALVDRKMPFQLPADAVPVPRELLSEIREPRQPIPPLPAEAPRPSATVRRLPTFIRAAAAMLVLGATAWFLRTQIPSAEAPAIDAEAQAQPTGIDSINDQAIDGFMRDTEVVTSFETIGTEVAWTDAYGDIASADLPMLDKELASLSEHTLLAYVNETGIPTQEP